MDREDRVFVKVVGSKMLKQLKTSNLRLYKVFMERCNENGDKPERVLGVRALNFAKSIVEDDGEYAESILGKTIKISALQKREKLYEGLREMIEIRNLLSSSERDEIDSLISDLLKREIKKSASSPLDALQNTQQPSNIVIDENVLAQMPEDSLDALEDMIKRVKEMKEASRYVSSEDLEEVDELEDLEGEDRFSDGVTEEWEEFSEGDRLDDGRDEEGESNIEDDSETSGDREEQ